MRVKCKRQWRTPVHFILHTKFKDVGQIPIMGESCSHLFQLVGGNGQKIRALTRNQKFLLYVPVKKKHTYRRLISFP